MALDSAWLDKARAVVGDRLLRDADALAAYAGDEYCTDEHRAVPAAVARPVDEREVAAIVRLCAEHGVPVTVRGGGTGLAAGCVASPGGIVLSTELMNKVVDADPANMAITVQSGMPLRRLYEEVEKMSLYFPPHPGDEGAQIGGAVAANAGGARAVKYGTVRRFVQGLQVVLASGEILDLGGAYLKSSAGYHLAELMAGSEGTLGIITRVTLGLLPRPGSVVTLVAPFATVEAAIGAVRPMFDRGIVPCAVEFVEHEAVRCGERLLQKTWPARKGSASLMVILDGRDAQDTDAQAVAVAESLEGAGALDVLVADKAAHQREILEIRSALYEAIHPGVCDLYDVCVPRAQVAAHVMFVHELEQRLGVQLPAYGHAADGNVHSHSLRARLEDGVFGPELRDWRKKREAVRAALYEDVRRRGGVISGEHGIGLVRKAAFAASIPAAQLEAMKAVKRALDPRGILNPGKIFDA